MRTSDRYRTERAAFMGVARQQDAPCWLCGKAINWNAVPQSELAFELDHALPLVTHPELELDHTNFRASHSKCNRERGATPVATSARPSCSVMADW